MVLTRSISPVWSRNKSVKRGEVKKLFNLLLTIWLLAFLILPGFPVQPAKAANYRKINSLTFTSKVEDYMWAWRAPTGTCKDREPRKGNCLSPGQIWNILKLLKDPDANGDLGDSYFRIQDPTQRIAFLNDPSKPKTYILRILLVPFEQSSVPPYWINEPSSKINNDNFFKILADALAGDDLIVNLLYPPVPQQTDGMPPKNRSKLSEREVYNIYHKSARMAFFSSWRCQPIEGVPEACSNTIEWIQEEKNAFESARHSVENAYKFLRQNSLTPTKAQKIISGLRDNNPTGGTTILSGGLPVGLTLSVGSQQIVLSSENILRIFVFFSDPTHDHLYQKSMKMIASGATTIALDGNVQYMPDINQVLVDLVKKNVFVVSREWVFDYFGKTTAERFGGLTVFPPPTIYYVDSLLDYRNENPKPIIVHEMFHYLRYKVQTNYRFLEQGDNFNEAFTEFLSRYTIAKNNKSPSKTGGYQVTELFDYIVKRIMIQNNWTRPETLDYLKKVYFHSPFNTIDTVTKQDFRSTLGINFGAIEDLWNKFKIAKTPTERKAALEAYNNLRTQTIQYIQN